MTEATPAAGAPTVLLVHGAFANGSSWAGVIGRLQAAGVQVRALQKKNGEFRSKLVGTSTIRRIPTEYPIIYPKLPGADLFRELLELALLHGMTLFLCIQPNDIPIHPAEHISDVAVAITSQLFNNKVIA